jgi:hypothetical protein
MKQQLPPRKKPTVNPNAPPITPLPHHSQNTPATNIAIIANTPARDAASQKYVEYKLPDVAERWKLFIDRNLNTFVLVVALRYTTHLHLDGLHLASLAALFAIATVIFFIGTKIDERLHQLVDNEYALKAWIFTQKVLGYAETVVTVFIVNVMSSYIQSRINDEMENFATISIPVMILLTMIGLSMFMEYHLSKSLTAGVSNHSRTLGFFQTHAS